MLEFDKKINIQNISVLISLLAKDPETFVVLLYCDPKLFLWFVFLSNVISQEQCLNCTCVFAISYF